jgi:hypothetical protein
VKPVEVFEVVVLAVGLVVCLFTGGVLFWAGMNLILGGPASPGGLAILGVPPLLVGLWLLRGVPILISFAFPNRNGEH